ncbi:MAG: MgtC/SapB family protein [Thermoflavifilum aggregans]|nr:MgtC/SapB family protein [Thermoflavifilum aggregans]
MLTTEQLIIRLVVAALLGSLVGLERQRLDWAAGLRTHMMVCVGSALVIIVSAYGFNDVLIKEKVVLDPSRVAAQVVSGIGFLGAGTILFLRHEAIRGLTTAAGLWTVAAIGLAVGSGLYEAGVITTILALIILALMKPLEKYIVAGRRSRNLKLLVDRKYISLQLLEQMLDKQNIELEQMVIQRGDTSDEDYILLTMSRATSKKKLTGLAESLRAIKGIKEVSFQTDKSLYD